MTDKSALSSTLSSAPIRTIIVGYGLSGQSFHAPFIKYLPQYQLIGIVSTNPNKVRADFPDTNIKIYPSFENALTNAQADLYIFATPNNLHFSQACDLLNQNPAHIVIDKPFTINSKDGEELINLAHQKNKTLSVFQSKRWDGDFLTIKKLINENKLGEVHTIISNIDRFRPNVQKRWKEDNCAGSGIVWDLAVHLIDQVRELWGLPDSINAKITKLRPQALADDNFTISLNYGKKTAIVHGDNLTCLSPRFQVHGSLGSFIKYGFDPQESLLRQNQGPEVINYGVDAPKDFGVLYTADINNQIIAETIPSEIGCYQEYYIKLAQTINNPENAKNLIPVTPESALENIRLIEIAFEKSFSKAYLT